MKINLRNKSGQFCNFAEFASENPKAQVLHKATIKEAAEYLEDGMKALIELRRLAEIIRAFNLPQNTFFQHSGLEIHPDGRWSGWSDDIDQVITIAEDRMEKNKRLAAVWTADSYETPDN